MLTYDLSTKTGPLYERIYTFIKEDIREGKLVSNDKLPSKRSFAENLGVSTITVENAYELLLSEGYVYSSPKRGYFVAELSQIEAMKYSQKLNSAKEKQADVVINIGEEDKSSLAAVNLSSNMTSSEDFPFSIWAKLMRETISMREKELLTVSPCAGVRELRDAISEHLRSFRGMEINPDQIIVGAGTEYLYGLIIKLLGASGYCIENPGYRKLVDIYESNGAVCHFANLDEQGIIVNELIDSGADVAHISPTHHFPTGITMPVARRLELLKWANEKNGRYIIEDDYDSEFRLNGRPIQPLMSLDTNEKVIYMNTFSKTLTSTIRISYMVLPPHLASIFHEKLSFYSCTVSTFEQYTLAAFISRGYLEKHINRMRLHYGRKRNRVLQILNSTLSKKLYKVIENDSGLHFIIEINTDKTDRQIKDLLLNAGISIAAITDYEMERQEDNPSRHQFILNYSGIEVEKFSEVLPKLKAILEA